MKVVPKDDVIIMFLNNMPILIKYLPYKYKNDKKIMLLLCKKDRTIIRYASNELRADYDFMNELIDFYPPFIYYAHNKLKDNYVIGVMSDSIDYNELPNL